MVDNEDTPILIQDEGEHRYFVMIPFLIDDLKLSPYAVRLYVRLKRRAGESGECWENTRNLASGCHMSPMSVSRAKKELQQAELITVEMKSRHGEFSYHLITVRDIWKRNNANYSACTSQVQDLYLTEYGTCTSGDTKVDLILRGNAGEVKKDASSASHIPRAKSARAGGNSRATSSVGDLIDHPAIQAIKRVSGYYPRKNRITYQTLIDWIGDSPKIKRLEWAHAVYTGEWGKDPMKIIEWVKQGYVEGFYYEPRRPILPEPGGDDE